MTELRYPIGIQSFQEIRNGGYVYVDKTGFIPLFTGRGKYFFLSRPRRFGKSLLLSTLHAYFESRRDLFRGLEIDRMDVDWTPRPVLHFDLNAEDFTNPRGLDLLLDWYLNGYEKVYEIDKPQTTLARRFSDLLKKIHDTTGRKVVILVDEYDKPLLNIEHKPEIFEKNQATLKGFFGVLKSMDPFIEFALLTGVARFNKVSIFSDLNNLNDISLDNDFADICGWTETELINNFSPGITRMAKKLNLSFNNILDRLRYYYDGYRFAAEGNRIYNPFSILNALSKRELGYYWFSTGTPSFLVRRIKNADILLPSLNRARSTEADLSAVGIEDRNPIPILFQTGYLTINRKVRDRFELRFPNEEVESGFARSLLPLYLPAMTRADSRFSIWDFEDELFEGNPENFMLRLQTMIKDVPYEQHNEKFYQNVVYLLFTLMGIDTRIEEHSSRGRADLILRTPEVIYIFEFKYNGSPQEAIRQIRERDYAGRFALDKRQIIFIGANFSDQPEKRGLTGWIIEKL